MFLSHYGDVFMRKIIKRIFFVASLCTVLGSPLTASTIYDNSTNDLLTTFTPAPNAEVGDQIILDGTDRFVTKFAFEYFGDNTTSGAFLGPVSVKVRFYDQNGGLFNGQVSPGSLLWSSGWIRLEPTPRQTLNFGPDDFGAGVMIPGNQMTWSVEFSGFIGNDRAGVDLYSPPTIGNNYPDYWQRPTGGAWVLMTNVVAMDFGARLEAAVIPEPASFGLSLFGGLSLLIFARRFRRK
jgi:hypothetical protein